MTEREVTSKLRAIRNRAKRLDNELARAERAKANAANADERDQAQEEAFQIMLTQQSLPITAIVEGVDHHEAMNAYINAPLTPQERRRRRRDKREKGKHSSRG